MIWNKRIYGVVREINLNELKMIFNSLKYIKIALLFGSRSSNNYTPKSDYDFACLFDNSFEFEFGTVAKVWMDISIKLDLAEYDIDIIDLDKVDVNMKKSIKESFILLKGSEDELYGLLRE